MAASVTHSGVSISPDPVTAKSYAGAVGCTVTAEDGSTQTYRVTVTVAASSGSGSGGGSGGGSTPADWRLDAMWDIYFYAAGAYWYPKSYTVINYGATCVVH
jgi:hypothetical protein